MHQVGLQRAVRAMLIFVVTILVSGQVVGMVPPAEAAQPAAMTIIALALDLPAETFGGLSIGTTIGAVGFDGAGALSAPLAN
ncbi:MAG: hypothetical protein AAF577_03510 [Pseudomonadota bacterium]